MLIKILLEQGCQEDSFICTDQGTSSKRSVAVFSWKTISLIKVNLQKRVLYGVFRYASRETISVKVCLQKEFPCDDFF